MEYLISASKYTLALGMRLVDGLVTAGSRLFRNIRCDFSSTEQLSDVTRRLNEIFADERSDLDIVLINFQAAYLPKENW
jgi:hypothetical protein